MGNQYLFIKFDNSLTFSWARLTNNSRKLFQLDHLMIDSDKKHTYVTFSYSIWTIYADPHVSLAEVIQWVKENQTKAGMVEFEDITGVTTHYGELVPKIGTTASENTHSIAKLAFVSIRQSKLERMRLDKQLGIDGTKYYKKENE